MYKVVYNRLPQDTELDEYLSVSKATYNTRETIGFSADDAVYLVNNGSTDSKIVLWNIDRQEFGIIQWLEDREVETIEYEWFQEGNNMVEFGLHAFGSDWQWERTENRNKMEWMNMTLLYLSNGINKDYLSYSARIDKTYVRINPNMKDFKTPAQLWEESKENCLAFYRQGIMKFIVLNEVNYEDEGYGVMWNSPSEYVSFLKKYVPLIRRDMPHAELYFTPYTQTHGGRDYWYDKTWHQVHKLFNGLAAHVYANNNLSVEQTAKQLRDEILHIRDRYSYKGRYPIAITELSVNRGRNMNYKAKVYRELERIMRRDRGIDAVFYFIALWEHNSEHGENWFDSGLAEKYKELK